jgi:hypothetical protein
MPVPPNGQLTTFPDLDDDEIELVAQLIREAVAKGEFPFSPRLWRQPKIDAAPPQVVCDHVSVSEERQRPVSNARIKATRLG